MICYLQSYIYNRMKKQAASERSGVVRCQRCLKFGHYTYQCENQAAYRYRPSPTVMYKEKIKLQLNKDKGPKTVIRDQDYKRVYVEDKPSSQQQPQNEGKQEQNTKKEVKNQEGQEEKQVKKALQRQQGQEQESESSSSSSQSSSSSSSSSSSEEELEPKKKRKI